MGRPGRPIFSLSRQFTFAAFLAASQGAGSINPARIAPWARQGWLGARWRPGLPQTLLHPDGGQSALALACSRRTRRSQRAVRPAVALCSACKRGSLPPFGKLAREFLGDAERFDELNNRHVLHNDDGVVRRLLFLFSASPLPEIGNSIERPAFHPPGNFWRH